MHIPKQYGESKAETCIFCGKAATLVNAQGISVCPNDSSAQLDTMRCVCGDALEIKDGKYGTFFLCLNCGPQSMAKVLSINTVRKAQDQVGDTSKKNASDYKTRSEKERTQPMVRSDDPRYFD
ncbi:hypothetical protein HYV81_05800 [Candidatus Woesearchaeota archaeon]|nr:hypothetical protein [Candidatus Woesearchaeota archaeon]